MRDKFAMDPTMTSLAKEFENRMLDTYELSKQYNYYPTRFVAMVQEHGGVQTAKRLLASPDVQPGLFTLWELGRLDLSMEAIVLEPEFQPLFTAEELAHARKRLKDLHYIK